MIGKAEQMERAKDESAQCATSKLLSLAMLLYAISMIKFYLRDPLSAQTGPQGVIEILLVIGASVTLVPALRALHYKPFIPPAAKAFLLFGILAAVSSAFSYDPLLSFVKAVSFLLVCGTAVAASSAFGPDQVFRSFFYAVVTVLMVGLLYKLASGGPWFVINDYSGRARFSLFALHPGSLADLCALTLLSSFLPRRRLPIYLQVLLFVLNIATAARASSALLLLVLLVWGFEAVRFTPRLLFICGFLCFLATLTVWVGLQRQSNESHNVEQIGRSLYGDKLDQDITTLNGRTEVWKAAGSLLSQSLVLGFGIDGARNVLIAESSWGAGNAHNSILELILAAGVPGTFVFLFGWAGSVRRAWISSRRIRFRTLGIYFYIAIFGMTAPNLTYLQYVAVFLIITLDSMLYAEFRIERKFVAETISDSTANVNKKGNFDENK